MYKRFLFILILVSSSEIFAAEQFAEEQDEDKVYTTKDGTRVFGEYGAVGKRRYGLPRSKNGSSLILACDDSGLVFEKNKSFQKEATRISVIPLSINDKNEQIILKPLPVLTPPGFSMDGAALTSRLLVLYGSTEFKRKIYHSLEGFRFSPSSESYRHSFTIKRDEIHPVTWCSYDFKNIAMSQKYLAVLYFVSQDTFNISVLDLKTQPPQTCFSLDDLPYNTVMSFKEGNNLTLSSGKITETWDISKEIEKEKLLQLAAAAGCAATSAEPLIAKPQSSLPCDRHRYHYDSD